MKNHHPVVSVSLSFIFLLTCMCCEPIDKKKTTKKGIKDGVVRQYREGKILKNEITYKNGQRDGLAKTYYKDGSLRQEITYKKDKKHGKAITYYENGKVYQETPYVENKIQGIRKKYRQNGKLMAEIPYHQDQPCQGLKEYLLNGKLKKKYPKITIQERNNILKNGQFDLIIKMSDGSKKVDFYIDEKLTAESCLSANMLSRSNYQPGAVKLSFNLPVNAFIMKELTIVAKAKTLLGNPYITTTKHHLAIENRGY